MRFYKALRSELYDFARKRLEFGSCCVLCLAVGRGPRDLCDTCESLLVRRVHKDRANRNTQLCLACGAESDVSSVPVCEHRRSPFVRIVAPYRYAFPLDKLIHQMKYRNRRILARVLGSLLSAAVPKDAALPDCLVPVPLATDRECERGFNQAADIAHWCSRELGIPHWPGAVKRHMDTGSLAGLSRAARQQRVVGAFGADDAVFGKRVAIVDDVLTTGATARELATELYDAGALSVELWVLARTSRVR